jgi:hypothetical protein
LAQFADVSTCVERQLTICHNLRQNSQQAQLAAAQKELETAQFEEISALALKTELQSRIGDPLAWQKEKDGLELHISTLRSKVKQALL